MSQKLSPTSFRDLSATADITSTSLRAQIDSSVDLLDSIAEAEAALVDSTKTGSATAVQTIQLAKVLVQSKSSSLIQRGIFNLQELLSDTSHKLERDVGLAALYYLALGNFKLGNYRPALADVDRLLALNATHKSGLALQQLCIDKMISKQNRSGIISKILRRKSPPEPLATKPPPLPIMTPEEEQALRLQTEQNRADLAAMFCSTNPQIDEDEMVQTIIQEEAMRKWESQYEEVNAQSEIDQYFVQSPFDNPPASTSQSSTEAYYSPKPTHTSTPVNLNPAPAQPASNPRASMWVRSTKATDGFTSARPHDSLPSRLLRVRPLRASQSSRTAPHIPGVNDHIIEDNTEEDEEEEETVFSASAETAAIEAELANLLALHSQQAAEIQHRQQSQISQAQIDYQQLLQVHQSAQYALLKVQQTEITELQEAQMLLIQEEQQLQELPFEQRDQSRIDLLHLQMQELAAQQGPLLEKQRQQQIEIVQQQQLEQKTKQDIFEMMVRTHEQERKEALAIQQQQTQNCEQRLQQQKQLDQQAYEALLEEKRQAREARKEQRRLEKLRLQEEARQEALRQEALRQEALRQEALRQEALRQQALLEEQERLRQEQVRIAAEQQRQEEERQRQWAEEQRRAQELEARQEQERQRVLAEQNKHKFAAATTDEPEVIDVFSIMAMKPGVTAPAAPASTKILLSQASLASPPPALAIPGSGKLPMAQPPPPMTLAGGIPASGKLPMAQPPAPIAVGGPPSIKVPVPTPTMPAHLTSTSTTKPSMAPPSGPPKLPATLPPLPATGPPTSTRVPFAPTVSPPSIPDTSFGRPTPTINRPTPQGTIQPSLAAFANSDKPNFNRPAPPVPAVSKAPPMPRVPAPNPGPPVPSTSGGLSRPVPSNPVNYAVQQPKPVNPSSSPLSAGSRAPPALEDRRGVSRYELSSATSSDARKGVTKDKAGLPVFSKPGGHLLATASRAKGPSRRPPTNR